VLRCFYEAHFPSVYRYVLCRLGGDHAATEEAVNEVFFNAFRRAEQYDGRHAPELWLKGIARHLVLDIRRKSARRGEAVKLFEGSEWPEDLDEAEIPHAALERRETAELVEQVLTELPGDYEAVLRLHYLEEKPVVEVAGRLKITEKAAEARLFRARQAFREAYARLERGPRRGARVEVETDKAAEGGGAAASRPASSADGSELGHG
jgi:RNA polymerase sigma-70 factor (ECF subfamily)